VARALAGRKDHPDGIPLGGRREAIIPDRIVSEATMPRGAAAPIPFEAPSPEAGAHVNAVATTANRIVFAARMRHPRDLSIIGTSA
jgi:hypothetical protein